MKPIKEYNCSQEKLNPKKFFPVILFLFGFAFSFVLLLSASAESQTLKSISGNDTAFRNKISAGFYNSQSNDDIGSFDIKPEFLLDVMGDETAFAIGINMELEFISTRKTSWVISLTPYLKSVPSQEFVRLSGIILTGGRKFYFNDSKARGYFTINLGGYIGSTSTAGLSQSKSSLAFVILPAFGFEYNFSDAIKFESELKIPFLFPGGLYGYGAILPGMNAGIGFLF